MKSARFGQDGSAQHKSIPLGGILAAMAWLALANTSCSIKGIDTEHYYLCIGISEYSVFSSLHYPTQDATDLGKLLSERGWQNAAYEKDSSLWEEGLLLDENATKENIKDAIEKGFKDVTSDATILVYFSGHGTTDESTGTCYLLPYDYSTSNGFSKAISPAELNSWFSTLHTKNIIFISDSCYSGGFVSTQDSEDTMPALYQDGADTSLATLSYSLTNFGSLLAKNAETTGALAPIAISAAGAKEFSYEGDPDDDGPDQGHGIFTYYLLEAAQKGDSNQDGNVTCTEAYSYTARCINEYWNDKYGNEMSFYPHISGGARDLVLYCKSQDGG